MFYVQEFQYNGPAVYGYVNGVLERVEPTIRNIIYGEVNGTSITFSQYEVQSYYNGQTTSDNVAIPLPSLPEPNESFDQFIGLVYELVANLLSQQTQLQEDLQNETAISNYYFSGWENVSSFVRSVRWWIEQKFLGNFYTYMVDNPTYDALRAAYPDIDFLAQDTPNHTGVVGYSYSRPFYDLQGVASLVQYISSFNWTDSRRIANETAALGNDIPAALPLIAGGLAAGRNVFIAVPYQVLPDVGIRVLRRGTGELVKGYFKSSLERVASPVRSLALNPALYLLLLALFEVAEEEIFEDEETERFNALVTPLYKDVDEGRVQCELSLKYWNSNPLKPYDWRRAGTITLALDKIQDVVSTEVGVEGVTNLEFPTTLDTADFL